MRLSLPRLTIRSMMVTVAAVGSLLGLCHLGSPPKDLPREFAFSSIVIGVPGLFVWLCHREGFEFLMAEIAMTCWIWLITLPLLFGSGILILLGGVSLLGVFLTSLMIKNPQSRSKSDDVWRLVRAAFMNSLACCFAFVPLLYLGLVLGLIDLD